MTVHERTRGYLSLAARAGCVESGEFATEKAIKSRKAQLVCIAEDASENTKKKFQNMCTHYEVPVLFFGTRETLGRAIGRDFRALMAVTGKKLAEAIMVLQQGE